MTTNPYNLVLRLVLEFYGYIVFGFTGFFITDSILRWPLAVLMPIAAGFFWGTFYVEKDPAGVGKAIIKVNGLQRLILEFLFYSLTVFLSFVYVSDLISYVYLYLILVHNIFSYDRISWLIKSRTNDEVERASV
ncbi:MAG: DUF2568 domain-containing protein [Bacteroidota bacterium]